MTTGDVKRKLTAIFSADVEGYSRLMEEDELATIETLTLHKETMGKLIRQYRGRVVDSTGDNLLAEFASVVDAVQCAVEVQQVLSAKNETFPENRRMYFRIGINLGDVVEEGERIYGDGVNVAARVESLAEGGGISISGTAYDQLGKKLPLGYKYLGEQTVKNIEKPVRVYRVLTEAEAVGKVIGEKRPKTMPWRWAAVAGIIVILAAGVFAVWNFFLRPDVEPASVERMAFPLPDKPSIAVLPFVNMSEDPKQEFFSDGLTDTIITSLSRIPHLFVIASNSSFTYKGKPVKVQKVAEDLGVRYVLEGSIQTSEKKMRIRAQLIDAISGRHVWADSYDRTFEDVFALQDDIASKVITSLQVELTSGEYARAVGKGTKNLEALQLWWRAQHHYLRFTKEDNTLAKQYAEKAIEIDPEFSTGWAELGFTHTMDAVLGLSSSPEQSMKLAEECARKALSLNPMEPKALLLVCRLSQLKKDHDKAIEYAEKAVKANPNNPYAFYFLGFSLMFVGRSEEAIPNIRKAMRLTPHYPPHFLDFLAYSLFFQRRYDEAIPVGEKILERGRKGEYAAWIGYILMIAIYSELGQDEKARNYAAEFLAANPNWTLQVIGKFMPFKEQSYLNRLLTAGRKAGLPDKPPLPLPDKPSIAVLPFVNMSGDPEQEYFSDGISEEIITALSKTPKMFVIARNSTFSYKGKPVKVQQIGRELGVRYVLEGSVRKDEDKVRVTAQLVDAATGKHLWAERYDRNLKDIFALQDEITMKIITELQVNLTEGERVRGYSKGTNNLEAYLKYLQGYDHFKKGNKEDNARARQMCEEAIALDPQYPVAYAMLGWIHWSDVWLKASRSPRESISKAFELAQKSIALDDYCQSAHLLLSNLYLITRQHEKAIAEGERAIALDPNSADAYALFGGQVLFFSGKPEEGALLVEKAIRLNPIAPSWYFQMLGMAYRETGRYEESISACKKAINREPNNIFAYLTLVGTYSMLGREDEARATAAEVLRIDPEFSVEYFARTRPHIDPANTARFADALRKAGLK
jgi:TolB-like protein/class 3 adenylate cyclase/cytochrome c-type biogenesis protein CcmH/NrfG